MGFCSKTILARVIAALLLLLCLISKGYSAYSDICADSIKINKIDSNLELRSEEQEVLDHLGINPGKVIKLSLIRKSIAEIYKLGFCANIEVSYSLNAQGEYLLCYSMERKKIIRRLKLTGAKTFQAKDLFPKIELTTGQEDQPHKLNQAALKTEDFLKNLGFYEADLKIKSEPIEGIENEREIVFSINEGERSQVAEINFQGQVSLPEAELLNKMKLSKGKNFYPEKLQKDLSKLKDFYLKKDYPEVIIGDPQIKYLGAETGVEITIPIESGSQVVVNFQGLEKLFLTRHAVERLLLIKKEQSATEAVLNDSLAAMLKLLKEKGYHFAEGNYEIKKTEGKKDITFNFKLSSKVKVKNVKFNGNYSISTKKIKRVMLTTSSTLGFGGLFIQRILEDDLKAISRLYHKNGFLESEISYQLDFNDPLSSVEISIDIQEGRQTLLDSISFYGNIVFTSEELAKKFPLQAGAPYDPEIVESAANQSILPLYSEKGYTKANLKPQLATIDGENPRVKLNYEIFEGDSYRIGYITTFGLNLTKEEVVTRELEIKEGDLFNPEKIYRSQHKIYALDLFRRVKMEQYPSIEDPMKIDLVIKVTEKPAGEYGFSLGYGSDEGARVGFTISHRNLTGWARRVHLIYELSETGQDFSLGYTEPWLFNIPITGEWNLYRVEKQADFYDLRKFGNAITITKKLTPTIKALAQYKYENVDLFYTAELPPDQQQADFDDIERLGIGSVSTGLIWDNRDDFFFPKRGTLSGMRVELANELLVSEIDFLRYSGNSAWFFKLPHSVVLALSARFGTIFTTRSGEDVPVYERFLMGGRTTMRAYGKEDLGPNKKIPGENVTRSEMYLTNLEFRLPLWRKLGWRLFLDSGEVRWRIEYPDSDQPSRSESSAWKNCLGIGLHYMTPLGPLSFDYGYKLQPEEDESNYEWFVNLGLAF